jgi:DNA-binding IclR family transcriptional regulator
LAAHRSSSRSKRSVGREVVERADSQFVVQALARGLAVLSLFDAENREWSLDEITAQLGLPRMTAYRMARTLLAADYLVTDRVSGRYRLGPALLASTYLSEGYAELAKMAQPYLTALVEQTGESATLAVEVDGVAVCVDMVESSRPHRREVAVGRIIGDTANAHGKMFAACKSDEEREAIVHSVHERHTPATVTDPDELRDRLEDARREGVAFDLEERDLGTCACAAPVRDQTGKVIATLAVVIPTGRFDDAAKATCAAAVQETAASFSAFVGYSGSGEASR